MISADTKRIVLLCLLLIVSSFSIAASVMEGEDAEAEKQYVSSDIPKKFADKVFGFTIDESKAIPDVAVTYTDSCQGYLPARQTNIGFNYGSRKEFVEDLCRPVVLKRGSGTNKPYFVAEELDRNDLTKTIDGKQSSISNPNSNSYGFEAMVEFKKYYINVSKTGSVITVKFSKRKLNDSYHAYAFLDANGVEHEYLYMSIYDGFQYGSVRSLSGKTVFNANLNTCLSTMSDKSGSGFSFDSVYTANYLRLLHVLISKITSSSRAFGMGYTAGGLSNQNSGVNDSGGGFVGVATDSHVPVSTFWIENLWGNRPKWELGVAYRDGFCYVIDPGRPLVSAKTDSTDYRLAFSQPNLNNEKISEMTIYNDLLLPTAGSPGGVYDDYATIVADGTDWTHGRRVGGGISDYDSAGIWKVVCNASTVSAIPRLTYLAGTR